MKKQKLITISLVIAVVFIFMNAFYQSSSFKVVDTQHDLTNEQTQINLKTTIKENIELFKRLGNKHGTDKISTHNYHYLYGANIGQFRDMEINFLEIGLGCGGNGAGKSLSLWKEFMPKANIYMNAPSHFESMSSNCSRAIRVI